MTELENSESISAVAICLAVFSWLRGSWERSRSFRSFIRIFLINLLHTARLGISVLIGPHGTQSAIAPFSVTVLVRIVLGVPFVIDLATVAFYTAPA